MAFSITRRRALGGLAAAAFCPRDVVAAPQDLRAAMFRRSLLCELPFLAGGVQDRMSAKVYPQGLAFDAAGHEVFIFYSFLKRDPNFGTLCCVYDVPSRSLKTWFLTKEICREGFVYRKVGSRRLVYTLGLENPLFYDVTNKAEPGSVLDAAKVFDPEERSYAQLAWTGREFVYMSGEADERGHKRKQRFVRADSEFRPSGAIIFPLDVVGSYDSKQMLRYPKAQGVAYSRGMFIFSCGKNFALNARGPKEDPQLASTQQGLIACDQNGQRLTDALVSPDFAIRQFGAMAGRQIPLIENESITSAGDGRLFAIWQTSHPRQWATEGRQSGLLITEEMSAARDAIDFSPGAVSLSEVMSRRINADP